MVECLSLDHAMVSGGQPEVKLNNSRLLGLLSMHEGRKVSTFLGIPFAEPPTGQLRYLCISHLLSIILSTVSLFRLRTPNRTTTVSAHSAPSIYHSLDNRTTTVSAHFTPSIYHSLNNKKTTVYAHSAPSIYHSLDNRTTKVFAHCRHIIYHSFHFLAVPNSVLWNRTTTVSVYFVNLMAYCFISSAFPVIHSSFSVFLMVHRFQHTRELTSARNR